MREKDLETSEVRLNCTESIISLGKHLLQIIKKAKYMDLEKGNSIKVPLCAKEDFKLWSHLMKKGRDGISYNNIIEMIPPKSTFQTHTQ